MELVMLKRASYYADRCSCPICGNREIVSTCVGYVFTTNDFRDENKATCCQCGWRGVVHELQKQKAPITRPATAESIV
jgi:hypothetical protein